MSRRTRLGRAKFVTYCATCEQTVGVVTTRFNKASEAEYVPKTSTHDNREGRKCPGSRLSIHPNTIMETEPAR